MSVRGPAARASARRPTGMPHVGLMRTACSTGRTPGTPAARSSSASRTPTPRATPRSPTGTCSTPALAGPGLGRGPRGRRPVRALPAVASGCEIYRDVARQAARGRPRLRVVLDPRGGRRAAPCRRADPKLGYDNHDRDLTDAQKAAFRAEGREPVLRLRMPDEDIVCDRPGPRRDPLRRRLRARLRARPRQRRARCTRWSTRSTTR